MEDFADSPDPEQYEEMKKYSQNVKIHDDLIGIGSAPRKQESVLAKKEILFSGSVSWYQDNIMYSVHGNGHLPLSDLIKVARSMYQ